MHRSQATEYVNAKRRELEAALSYIIRSHPLNQKLLGEKIGVSQSTLSLIARRTSSISLDTLIAIALMLKINVSVEVQK
jgi:transcriptional regulator with XRE-family HTH domain